MKEAVGNSYLLYIIVFFVGVIMLFFVAILSYSKAFRVKNRIINYVESNYQLLSKDKEAFFVDLNSDLKKLGYNSKQSKNCSVDSNYGDSCENLNISENGGGAYNFCLCKIKSGNGYFYEVITYSEFKIPIISNIISEKVYGETEILERKYNN